MKADLVVRAKFIASFVESARKLRLWAREVTVKPLAADLHVAAPDLDNKQ